MMGDRFYYSQARARAQEEEEEYEDEEEAEEALSLSDLPDLPNQPTSNDHDDTALARSSSQPQDFFEFFTDNNFSSDHVMCSADDIIFCGKLVPFREYPYLSPNPISKNPSAEDHNQEGDDEKERKQRGKAAAILGLRSRSESSSNLHSPRTTILTRNSRSLDYRKLQRSFPSVSNSPEMVDTNSSAKSFRKSADALAKRPATRPRWAVLMFGMAKFPAEMELEDIKTRRLRRNPATTSLFNIPAETRRSKGSSWKFLNALSCKDHNSVAVTSTSFACLPQSESFA